MWCSERRCVVWAACYMQALAPSLGGEVWAPVGCSRPGVAASSCWVYDPAVWDDGFLRPVVLKDCALPSTVVGTVLQYNGQKVQLSAATTVLLPAQLMLAETLDGPGSLRVSTKGVGLYAVTWSMCTATKARRPVLVVGSASRLSNGDLSRATMTGNSTGWLYSTEPFAPAIMVLWTACNRLHARSLPSLGKITRSCLL